MRRSISLVVLLSVVAVLFLAPFPAQAQTPTWNWSGDTVRPTQAVIDAFVAQQPNARYQAFTRILAVAPLSRGFVVRSTGLVSFNLFSPQLQVRSTVNETITWIEADGIARSQTVTTGWTIMNFSTGSGGMNGFSIVPQVNLPSAIIVTPMELETFRSGAHVAFEIQLRNIGTNTISARLWQGETLVVSHMPIVPGWDGWVRWTTRLETLGEYRLIVQDEPFIGTPTVLAERRFSVGTVAIPPPGGGISPDPHDDAPEWVRGIRDFTERLFRPLTDTVDLIGTLVTTMTSQVGAVMAQMGALMGMFFSVMPAEMRSVITLVTTVFGLVLVLKVIRG